MQDAIAADYGDDWGDNRERVTGRMREVMQFTHNLRIQSIAPDTSTEGLKRLVDRENRNRRR